MKSWVKTGLFWGTAMFIVMAFIIPTYEDQEITIKRTLISLVFWSLGGLLFGYSIKRKME